MSNNGRTKRILILGGGFAGLYAAMELEKTLGGNPGIEVTLVNRENFFLFTPMLHEVAASDLDLTTIVNPVRRMLKRVNFLAVAMSQADGFSGTPRNFHTSSARQKASCTTSSARSRLCTPRIRVSVAAMRPASRLKAPQCSRFKTRAVSPPASRSGAWSVVITR